MLLLVTATAKEMAASLAGCGQSIDIMQGQPQRYVLYGRECLLLVTGVGMLNAGLHLGKVLGGENNIDGVLNLGVAGCFAFNPLSLGHIQVVKSESWPEYGLGLEDRASGVDAKALKFPLARLESGTVWQRVALDPVNDAERLGLHLNANWPLAHGLTVNAVSACPERAEGLRSAYAADIETMEGFALAYACITHDLPFLEVRAISNFVGSRAPEHWDFQAAFAALGQAVPNLFGKLSC